MGPTSLGLFVGREEEVSQLSTGLEHALAGSGEMFLLTGEPGIGKTRLAKEVAGEARQRGAGVFWGRSTEAEGAPPFWPWVEILRSLLKELGEKEFGRLAGLGLADMLRAIPQLRGSFPNISEPPDADDEARFRTFDSITQLLIDSASNRPLLLVFDDLHWADAPSLLLLQHFAGNIAHAPLMVVGTYRDLELSSDHPLRQGLAEFVRRGETRLLPVGGLKDGAVASLVRAITNLQPSGEMVSQLQARTGGNPFFLAELIRPLGRDQGDPSGSGSELTISRVPEGVGALLRRRIGGLSPECRAVLETVAVIGAEFRLNLVEAAMKSEPLVLLNLLDDAIYAGVITSRDGLYGFAHALLRDTIYQSIPTGRRAQIHAAIAAVLEDQRDKDAYPVDAQLAYHFRQAAVVAPAHRAKAFQYATAAASRASSALAYEEAVKLLQLGLSVAPRGDALAQAALLVDLGRAMYLAGKIGPALEAAREAQRLAKSLGDATLMTRAALVVRGVGGPGVSAEVKQLCEVALERPPTDVTLRVQLLSQLAVTLMQPEGAPDESAAVQASQEALGLAETLDDADSVFAAIHARQMVVCGPAGVDERLELAERALELARKSGRRSIAQWGHGWRVDALYQLGRIDEAETELALLARLAGELREPLLSWRTLTAQAAVAYLRGHFEESRGLSEEARTIGRKGRHPPAELFYNIQTVALAANVGGLEDAYEGMEHILHLIPGMSTSLSAACLRAGILVSLGRWDEARAPMSRVSAAGLEVLGPVYRLQTTALLAEAVTALGDEALVTSVYDGLLPFAHQNVAAGTVHSSAAGSVSRYLGILAAGRDLWDVAARHFADALALENRMWARPCVVRTQVAYAEMLIRRGRRVDLARASELLDPAIATAQELGMRPWRERADKLRTALGIRGFWGHPLSDREFEVAGLVAEGLSNKSIAARFYLSERTVEAHVKNICDKLGFNSRAQVAAWVAAGRTSG